MTFLSSNTSNVSESRARSDPLSAISEATPFTIASFSMTVMTSPTFSSTSSGPTSSMSGIVISVSTTSFLVWKYVPVVTAGPASSSSSSIFRSSTLGMLGAFVPASESSELESEPEPESEFESDSAELQTISVLMHQRSTST